MTATAVQHCRTVRPAHTVGPRQALRPAHAVRPARASAVAVRRPVGVAEAPRREPARALHLTRRGRIVVLLVLVAVAGLVFSLGRVSAGAAPGGSRPGASTTVRPGESLWSVAQRIAPQSDPRDVVGALLELNHLSEDAGLRPGQVLLLPR
ncbi:MAG TPA: LysM peptidoglycan-binding domain-containing protein [Mycobacteriales bacterium]|nr:LysM peptidoglycan-binding domain-containing protein [Mycobacteriales bacterium]